jgi:lysine 2,3-aminomutase
LKKTSKAKTKGGAFSPRSGVTADVSKDNRTDSTQLDDIVEGGIEWSARRFLDSASDWLDIIRSDAPLDEIRLAILRKVDVFQLKADDAGGQIHAMDLVIVRDCARALRGMLRARSERLTGFSVLQALVDVAHGRDRPDLGRAFWADICHLFMGVEGRARMHIGDPLSFSQELTGRDAAIARSRELDWLGTSMDVMVTRFEDGLSRRAIARRQQQRARVLEATGATERDWSRWQWQLRNIALDADTLGRYANLTADESDRIRRANDMGMPFGVTPYYASLFDDEPSGRDRAVRAQVLPPSNYLDAMDDPGEGCGIADFMRESDTSPIDLVTRRYASIVILKPYNACPQICVYCQRNWEIKGPMSRGAAASKDAMDDAIRWLWDHPGIHEVLITGGDPMVLPDARLREILDRVSAIPHVERIRIGTRTPVTMPMRFTPKVCELLGSYRVPGRREVCVMTHVEHPYEVTPELVQAVDRLRRQGISVYNQLVYTFYVSRRFEAVALRRVLRRCGIDPYYSFLPKGKGETANYRVPIARLVQEQKEEARLLPGLARTDEPVYNVPGLGKNPLNSWQHRDLVGIMPDGSRAYEFHPWEKKIAAQKTFVGEDVPILEYLHRLAEIGEDIEDYRGIWFYF